jgi:nucleoside 2-deoxyribosyltransferase
MSKKIYLAGPWIDRDMMPSIANTLEQNGHTITHKWWQYEGKGEEFETEAFMRSCAVKDYRGVVDCDVVLVYNSAKSEGKAVEQGIALAFEKRIVLWTPGEMPSSNIFYHMHNYRHVKTIDEALKEINEYRG